MRDQASNLKDINLMFNATNPEIHYIVSAGQSIDIKTPGVYNVVPLNLSKIVAGYTQVSETPTTLTNFNAGSVIESAHESKSLLANDDTTSSHSTLTGNKRNTQSIQNNKSAVSDILFTDNLANLINETRQR